MTALGRILIVDDEEVVLDILSEYFAGQGYVAKPLDFGTWTRAVTAGLPEAGRRCVRGRDPRRRAGR